MKKLTRVIFVLIVFVGAASAPGGPLVKSRVGKNADWLVHADLDMFRSTQIGRLIIKELENQGIMAQLDGFATMVSFHPLNDIHGVTLCGIGPDKQKAVVLVDGKFDQDRMVGLVNMNPEYEEFKHSGVVVHGWIDENKRNAQGIAEKVYGCFYGESLLVLSPGRDAITHAVDVLKGQAANATGQQLGVAGVDNEDAFIKVAANGVGKMAGEKPDAAMLRQADRLGLAAGETGGELFIDIGLKANSAEAADSIKKMVEGVIAFVTLASTDNPKLAELAKNLKLTGSESTVNLRFQSSSRAVFDLLKAEWDKKQQQGKEL